MPTPSPTHDRASLPAVLVSRAGQPGCLDLREIAGDRFRVFPSEDHVPGSPVDPWNLELRGPYGRVWPYGGDLLLAYTDRSRSTVRTRLMALGVVHQLGDDEVTVKFSPRDLGKVAELLRLYVRRKMSPEARAVASARLRLVRPS